MKPKRFPIRFYSWYGTLSSALLVPPAGAYVEVDSVKVSVHMGWSFRSTFPRSVVVQAEETDKCPLSRGVHGIAGRWLVNGSGRGIVTINLTPVQRAYVMGFPVRLRRLMVSVTEPTELVKALTGSALS